MFRGGGGEAAVPEAAGLTPTTVAKLKAVERGPGQIRTPWR
jgi:hypothetical protein